jgi:hypothetical protein
MPMPHIDHPGVRIRQLLFGGGSACDGIGGAVVDGEDKGYGEKIIKMGRTRVGDN